jgi:hypothetical protein
MASLRDRSIDDLSSRISQCCRLARTAAYNRRVLKAGRLALIVSVVFTLVIGIALAMRAGYSPDEEITLFVVEGIRKTWTPRLPSGLDYWRGPVYSYSLSVVGGVFGYTLPAYRMFSVVLSLCAIGCTFVTARRISVATAAIAVVVMAIMPAFVANTAYARFYPALIAASAAALAALISRQPLGVYVAAALAARLSHEAGVAVVVFPAAAWLCGYELHASFRKWPNVLLAIGSLLVLHFALVSLQRAGIGGEAAAAEGAWLGLPLPMLAMWPIVQVAHWQDWLFVTVIALSTCIWLRRRVNAIDLIFIVAMAAAATVFSIGGILVTALFWLLTNATAARRRLLIAAAFTAASSICWLTIITVRTDIFMSVANAMGILGASLRSNMGGLEFLARELPIASSFIALATIAALFRPRSDPNKVTRVLIMIFLVYVLAFGIFGTDPRTRFIAVASPLMAMLAAAGACAFEMPGAARAAVALMMMAGVIVEQQQLVAAMTERPTTAVASPWSAWFPTVGLEQPFDSGLTRPQPNEIVITNDELAALLTLGRSDYWLAPDDFAARFYSRRNASGSFEGIYAASHVLVSADELRAALASGRHAATIVWFRSGKFGGVSPVFEDRASFPPGSMFQSTPDWSMIRIPAR